jgi:hypothetical protein
MYKNFQKLISVAFFYNKLNFYFVLLSSFFIIGLELFSIATFIPLFQILISKNIPSVLPDFVKGLSYDFILYLFLIFILSVFIFKNIILLILEWFIFSYQEIIRKKLSSDFFKYYLSSDWLENLEVNSSTKIRHIDGEVKNFSSLIFSFIKFVNEIAISLFLITILAFINYKILIFSVLVLLIFTILYFFLIRKKIY